MSAWDEPKCNGVSARNPSQHRRVIRNEVVQKTSEKLWRNRSATSGALIARRSLFAICPPLVPRVETVERVELVVSIFAVCFDLTCETSTVDDATIDVG